MHTREFQPSRGGQPAQISRKCAVCEEEEAKTLQPKWLGAPKAVSAGAPAIVHEVLRAPGQPLDPLSRAFFEPRFGHDLARVRLHTDAKAADSARAVGARAYTVGADSVFGAHPR